jgi:spermidine synthase
MELWFTENHAPSVRFSIKIKKQIFSQKSDFQQVDIFETFEFGKMLVIDGIVMVTEKDEFVYHEMLVHTPMAVAPDIKDVLVIGGGDGGTIRELTRYPNIRHIDFVEIDNVVIEACREHLTQTSCAMGDPRVDIQICDGIAYVKNTADRYDLILIDSTDPIGPGEGLFSLDFYKDCKRILNKAGIMVNQNESPYYEMNRREMIRATSKLKSLFAKVNVYQFFVPTYPSGHWMFGFASDQYDPVKDIKEDDWNALGFATKYYNTDIHKASFVLPEYVRELIEKA